MEQKTVFLDGEADQWYARNASALQKQHSDALIDPTSDPVLKALSDIRPSRLLEIGAANGWRLDVARNLWGSSVIGIEPSAQATAHAYPGVQVLVGTADNLPLDNGGMDCIVFGFCLYLCDRAGLFRIAAEADRVLTNGGYIVVYDFFPPTPYSNPYAHRDSVRSFKMDHSALWRWHPAYTLWRHDVFGHGGTDPTNPDDRLAVTVLRKHQ